MEAGEARQLVPVLVVEAHDLPGRLEPEEVGPRVVAQRGEATEGAWVARGRRVEEEPRIGEVVRVDRFAGRGPRRARGHVEPDHLLQVADAHVVGGQGEVLPAEALAGEGEIAAAALERLARVEALVHPPARALERVQPPLGAPAPAQQPLDQRTAAGALDPRREPAARRQVDAHAQEARGGAGEDLPEPDRPLHAARDRVRPSGALEEHQRFEGVGLDAVAFGRALHQGTKAPHPLGRGRDAAWALRVEHVRIASSTALQQLPGALGGEAEGLECLVGGRRQPRPRLAGQQDRAARRVLAQEARRAFADLGLAHERECEPEQGEDGVAPAAHSGGAARPAPSAMARRSRHAGAGCVRASIHPRMTGRPALRPRSPRYGRRARGGGRLRRRRSGRAGRR